MDQGYVTFPRVRLFYRTFGRGEPLVFLHGGPAFRHTYFLPWVEPLARSWKLVLYDQAGSGRSSKRTDAQYDFDTMTADLDGLRRGLGLGLFNLLGHSWGGMLALEYAARHPHAVRRLILADTFGSGRQLNRRLREMWKGATAAQRAVLARHERRGLFRDGPEYPAEYTKVSGDVYAPYYLDHMKVVPEELLAISPEFDVYRQIWGEHGEFRVTGAMKDWDGDAKLPKLPMPTLVIAGRYDQADPAAAQRMASRIPKGECAIFERSGHYPFIDQPDLFLSVLRDFLTGT